ncbi:MAG: Mu-like prophage major head subunit gpT family protein [Myxococcota bacterium]|nr:Mu-like prophage major head subunit gpT family protein [Myxococcota bacterium]
MTKLSTRSAPFVKSTLDVEKRTVQMIWTTGARVLRGGYDRYLEELSLDPGHVRMGRLQNGAPLLDSHDQSGMDSIIGVVESAQLDGKRGTAVVRFDRGPKGEAAMRMVAEGTLRGVSVGYAVHKLTPVEDDATTTPVFRATDWEPHELSLTAIGADPGAHVRSNRTKETAMSKKNSSVPADIAALVVDDSSELGTESRAADVGLQAERERSAGIARIARAFTRGLAPSDSTALEQLGDQLIRGGVSLERARARLTDERAARDDLQFDRRDPRIEAGRGSNTRSIELMAEALASRFGGPPPSDDAKQYVRLSPTDFAKHFLEQRGVNTRTMSKNQIVERSIGAGMHTTSDFPSLLTETGNRMLRTAYESYKGGLQRTARQVSAPDFRPIQKLQFGEVGTLDKVVEGGEFKNGTFTMSKDGYSLATFGRIFAVSRQAIVNDDIGAFMEMSTRLGRASSEFIASQLVALLASNPLSSDGFAVFHANHGNLAGVGAVISVASLGVAMKSMRMQKGLDGVTPIDVTPKFLVVPAALESVALQAVAQITPSVTSDVNPFAGKLEVIVDPRLDASSVTAWYLAADPAAIDGIEYAYLDGTGPELLIKEGWRIDGIEWKVRLDFGAGFVDYRSWYKNNGA